MTNLSTKKLGEVCEINPVKLEIKDISDDSLVSFVPMSAVSEVSQRIKTQEDRKFAEVKKGYTYFRKGDILFAKITPCMENGKVALANNLKNETGFASTEFHVIRAGEKVLPEYIYRLVASEKFRDEAKTKMTGSAGQKRVPRSFLENYGIPLPPLAEQKKIVARLEGLLGKIKEAKRLRAEAQEAAQNLLPAELHKIFEERKKNGWEEKELGDLFNITSSKRVFKSEWTTDGIPFYRAREIVSMAKGQAFKSPIFVSREMYQKYKEKYGVPRGGDILSTGVGTLGITYCVKDNDKFYFKDGNIIWLKKKSDVNSVFVDYFFKSNLFGEQVDANAGGATVRTFTIKTANKIKIRLPPVAEQKKIVARLDSLSGKIKNLREYQKSTASDFISLEQSILSKSF